MKTEIMYEVVPPSKRASKEYIAKVVDSLADALKRMRHVKEINIPEIVDENYCGIPYYRNLENREFGKILREKTQKEIIVNKVVAHFNPKTRFNEWLDESVKNYRIKKFIFVGGTFAFNYPGYNVLEANKIGSSRGLKVGNIMIPIRPNEGENLARKTANGSSFFTSQILFEAEHTIKTIMDYAENCRKQNFKPSTCYLSFSPVSDLEDIDFFKWLGVHFGEKNERRLRNAGNLSEESVKIVEEIYPEIVSKTESCGVPIALNIEQVTFHNLVYSEKLVEFFSENRF